MAHPGEVTDEQWVQLRPLIKPVASRRGRPRSSDQLILNGILYVLYTGCRWEDVPPAYGSGGTWWRRFREWEADGTWERLWIAFLALLDESAKDAWCTPFLSGHFLPTKKGVQPISKRNKPHHAAPNDPATIDS